jgi:hypothetical protein
MEASGTRVAAAAYKAISKSGSKANPQVANWNESKPLSCAVLASTRGTPVGKIRFFIFRRSKKTKLI